MVDIQNDEGLEILKERLTEGTNRAAVELLKTASVDVDFEDIIDEAFADSENRKFPIYSPEMATMSALYMQGQDVDPLVKEACENALKEWGITEISAELLTKEASNEIPDNMFILPSKRKLPAVDEESLYKSAATFVGHFKQLDVTDKVEGARQLYKIATEQYGISPSDLDEKIIIYAQEAPCDLNKLAMAVTERYAETHDDAYKSMIQKIASFKQELGGSISFDKSVNAGIAYDLVMLDKEAGVLDIFDAVYDVHNSPFVKNEETGELEKSATVNSIVVGRYSVPENELYKIAQDEFENAFPGLSSDLFEDGVMSVEKIENFVEEVPATAADELGRYLSGDK
jgi:hypothetical protein